MNDMDFTAPDEFNFGDQHRKQPDIITSGGPRMGSFSMKRVIIHWTAGGNRASDTDRKHYHRLVEYDGTIIAGTESIADNIVTSDGDYAAHTRNLNAGSIGVGMCGMRGAVEYPFHPGPSPLTEKQFRACAILVADLCRQYSIPVSRTTVLTHAEVQPTLGVRQRGKWDITRLPFKPDVVGAISCGDYFRDMVRDVMGVTPETSRPTLKAGNRSPRADVAALQADLAVLGYPNGAADGLFGSRTKAAVMALQADHGLMTDGIVGPATWSAMETAKQRPPRAHTEATLRAAGSTTIKTADGAERQTKFAAAGVGGLSVLQVGRDALTEVSGAGGILTQAQDVLVSNWPIIAVLAIAAVAYFKGPQLMQAIKDIRVRDAVSGEHLGR